MYVHVCISDSFEFPYLASRKFQLIILTMSGKCKLCAKNITTKQQKIECRECKFWFHGNCVNLSADDISFLVGQNEVWRCDTCSVERRKSMRAESELSKSDPKITDVIELLQEMRVENKEQIKRLEADIGKSVETCHEKIDELTNTIQKHNETLKAFEDKFNEALQENSNLKIKVNDLEMRLDDMEQYSRSNTLEINGIVETENENVIDVVIAVGNGLGYPITNDMIDACHRVGQREPEGRKRKNPRGIIVKFTRRSVKEDLLKQRRVKRNFNTKDIGISDRPAEVIYMNDSLTQRRRKILNEAKILKKEKGFQFLWVRNGKILLRTEEGAKVIALVSLEQVAALRASAPAVTAPRATTSESSTPEPTTP